MITRRIRVITFDLWNTIYSTDGPTASAVRQRRLRLLAEVLAEHGRQPTEEELEQAYRSGFDAYMAAWTSGRHFGAREQVLHILDCFAVPELAIDREAVTRSARAIEDAARLAPPSLLPGAREAIPTLAAAGYRLGLISDTSLTPGRVLREFLDKDGLAACFGAFTFSDELGLPKPDPRMFQTTLAQLGTAPGYAAPPHSAAHIGDTPRTDIAGAQALGMLAIRYTAVNDHADPPPADFVIKDHRDLLPLLARLNG